MYDHSNDKIETQFLISSITWSVSCKIYDVKAFRYHVAIVLSREEEIRSCNVKGNRGGGFRSRDFTGEGWLLRLTGQLEFSSP